MKEMLRYYVTEDGDLGELFVPKAAAAKAQEVVPGAALAHLFDEDDDMDGDVPDVSGDFARLGHLHEIEEDEGLPLTADFAREADGSLTLLRWPRLKRPAHIPAQVEGCPVTAIAATAFAVNHIPEEHFADLYSSPISFSVFSMRNGRYAETESVDQGGPTEVEIPSCVQRIGAFAFRHCDNLRRISIPEGVKELPAGVFADCSRLEQVDLPESLERVGYVPRPTDQVMPDIGTFAGCHCLRAVTFGPALKALGAHVFNSSSLVTLTVTDDGADRFAHPVEVAATAFDHSAALRWVEKRDHSGRILYQLGLPPARDKILAGDRRFGALLRIPSDFFARDTMYFDGLAQSAFRLDFSAQMALSRLAYPGGLSEENRKWYYDLLVYYYDRAPQFFPGEGELAAYERLFEFLQGLPDLTANHMSDLLRTAGTLGLPADFISRLMEIRTERFETVTGFEDLELDLDLDL